MSSNDNDARRLVQDAVYALKHWRSEINAVNERNLSIAMSRITAAQQAMGWPNRVTSETGPSAVKPDKMHYFMVLDAVREQLLKSSQDDMGVIDAVAEACFASLRPRSPQTPSAPNTASGKAPS